MKKILIIFTTIFSLMWFVTNSFAAPFPDTATWTLTHSELYDWYDTGGTIVTGTGQEIGDVTGIVKVEVKEEVFVNPENYIDAVFSYTVFNACYAGEELTSFHILNDYNIEALDYIAPVVVNDSFDVVFWTFSQAGDYYTWSTDDLTAGIEHGSSLNVIKLYVQNYGAWDLGSAAINIDGIYSESDDWVVSHPAPLPTTILLFGSGLIGLFGFRRHKNK
jgi:hypothetical protein